jgi:competence ComEA-like helix-hairpin-helix protein
VLALFVSPRFFSKTVQPIVLNKDIVLSKFPSKAPYQKRFYEKERVRYIYYNSKYSKERKYNYKEKNYNYKEKEYKEKVPGQYFSTNNYQPGTYYKKFEKKIIEVDINEADTSSFIALPGIGSKLASRIVAFREKLGGFYSVDQVSELYGLPDSVFQKIKPYLSLDNSASVHKININTASKEELKSHPYIRWQIANVIIAYRDQHGKFTEPEDLKKIPVITDDVFEKIGHYITL